MDEFDFLARRYSDNKQDRYNSALARICLYSARVNNTTSSYNYIKTALDDLHLTLQPQISTPSTIEGYANLEFDNQDVQELVKTVLFLYAERNKEDADNFVQEDYQRMDEDDESGSSSVQSKSPSTQTSAKRTDPPSGSETSPPRRTRRSTRSSASSTNSLIGETPLNLQQVRTLHEMQTNALNPPANPDGNQDQVLIAPTPTIVNIDNPNHAISNLNRFYDNIWNPTEEDITEADAVIFIDSYREAEGQVIAEIANKSRIFANGIEDAAYLGIIRNIKKYSRGTFAYPSLKNKPIPYENDRADFGFSADNRDLVWIPIFLTENTIYGIYLKIKFKSVDSGKNWLKILYDPADERRPQAIKVAFIVGIMMHTAIKLGTANTKRDVFSYMDVLIDRSTHKSDAAFAKALDIYHNVCVTFVSDMFAIEDDEKKELVREVIMRFLATRINIRGANAIKIKISGSMKCLICGLNKKP